MQPPISYIGSPLIPQAELRGLKMLPPHKVWLIEANLNSADKKKTFCSWNSAKCWKEFTAEVSDLSKDAEIMQARFFTSDSLCWFVSVCVQFYSHTAPNLHVFVSFAGTSRNASSP